VLSKRGLLSAAGLCFALAGLGVSWWREHLKSQSSLTPEAANALWQARLQTPDGQEVSLADFKGQKLILNFWATWCIPCVEEMPLIDAFFQQNTSKGFKVLGLAIDQPSLVRRFLSQRPVSYPVLLAGLEGTELSRTLGDTEGGLPFTLDLGCLRAGGF
jgi:thiol-disulfide isomerase/thioredoxin